MYVITRRNTSRYVKTRQSARVFESNQKVSRLFHFSPTKLDKCCWSRTAESELHYSCHLWSAACGNMVLNGRTCITINTETIRGLPQHGANPANPNCRIKGNILIYIYICLYYFFIDDLFIYLRLFFRHGGEKGPHRQQMVPQIVRGEDIHLLRVRVKINESAHML